MNDTIKPTHDAAQPSPANACSVFVVVAHRWGLRDAHSYVVGAFGSKSEADASAVNHLYYRGGKYGIEVVECVGDADDGGNNARGQVSYHESPYYGCAGQNRPACHPADHNKPITFDGPNTPGQLPAGQKETT